MNEVIKQMQKRIVEGIQLPDKKQQNQLRKDVEQKSTAGKHQRI